AALSSAALMIGFAPTGASATAAANVKVFMTGDCADGEHVEGKDEDDCEITVSVTPKSKRVSAELQVAFDEDDVEWETIDKGSTRGGRLVFGIPATDEDGNWMDGVVLVRVQVKRAAGIKLPKPKEYRIEYITAESAEGDEDLAEEIENDKEFNEEMDKAQSDNQRNIQNQQPNQDVYQKNGQSMDQGQRQNQPSQGQGGFDKAGVFNKACGSIGFSKDGCDKLVAAKSPKEATEILGARAEAWCAAIAESFGAKATCAMVLPNVFPPPRG
ncbi:MAG: hypothetical protein ACKOQ1_05590, partial [Actinomycetota bacterium]